MISYLVLLVCIQLVCSQSRFDIDTKIVGGENATISKYPYQVSLEIEGQHVCGGSLIRPNFVLTAAHCMIFPESLYSVRAGSTLNMQGGIVSKIIKFWTHPKFTPDFDYDVSVLKLTKPFDVTESIKPIPLQPVNQVVPDGAIGTVTGWGDLKAGGPPSKNLQEVGVPKTTPELCKMNDILHKITERMVCYGFLFGGKDACQMDSGGPLVVEDKQAGIVSWGMGCAVPLYPGVYTRISNKDIREHIDDVIAKNDN